MTAPSQTSPAEVGVASLDDFFARVCDANPFTDNRVNGPSEDDIDVDAIHQAPFERLVALAQEAQHERRGLGVEHVCCTPGGMPNMQGIELAQGNVDTLREPLLHDAPGFRASAELGVLRHTLVQPAWDTTVVKTHEFTKHNVGQLMRQGLLQEG